MLSVNKKSNELICYFGNSYIGVLYAYLDIGQIDMKLAFLVIWYPNPSLGFELIMSHGILKC